MKRAEGTLSEKALARLLALGVSFEGYECSADGESPNDRSAKTKSTRKSAKEVDARRSSARSNAVTKKPSSTTTVARLRRLRADDRETLSMVASLKAFQKERGEFAEPPLGSELAVWLANVRNRAATVGASDAERDQKQSMSPAERDRGAERHLGVELENFSPWHRGWASSSGSEAARAPRDSARPQGARGVRAPRTPRRQRRALLARAAIACGTWACPGWPARCSWTTASYGAWTSVCRRRLWRRTRPDDGSDGGSLAAKTVAAPPLRTNALARDAARAGARGGKEGSLRRR